jgi:hypothetical protein
MSEIPFGFSQVNYLFEGPGLPTGAQVTLGVTRSGASPPAVEAEAFWDYWRDELLPLQHDGIDLVGCLVKHGPNATGASGTYTASESGSAAGPGVTAAVSLLVQKVTASGGRTGKGRFYIPGLLESSVVAAGAVDSGDLAAWQTGLDDFYARFIAVGADPVLLHSPDSPVSTPIEITEFRAQGVVATQRRRQRR